MYVSKVKWSGTLRAFDDCQNVPMASLFLFVALENLASLWDRPLYPNSPFELIVGFYPCNSRKVRKTFSRLGPNFCTRERQQGSRTPTKNWTTWTWTIYLAFFFSRERFGKPWIPSHETWRFTRVSWWCLRSQVSHPHGESRVSGVTFFLKAFYMTGFWFRYDLVCSPQKRSDILSII